MSKSASVPRGVKPIWIGCDGSRDGELGADDDEDVELLNDAFERAEGDDMIKKLNMVNVKVQGGGLFK